MCFKDTYLPKRLFPKYILLLEELDVINSWKVCVYQQQ